MARSFRYRPYCWYSYPGPNWIRFHKKQYRKQVRQRCRQHIAHERYDEARWAGIRGNIEWDGKEGRHWWSKYTTRVPQWYKIPIMIEKGYLKAEWYTHEGERKRRQEWMRK
jgi:hypothetical protein